MTENALAKFFGFGPPDNSMPVPNALSAQQQQSMRNGTFDPVRDYLEYMYQQSVGDAGYNAGKSIATGVGVGLGTGSPALGAATALGYGGRAVKDAMNALNFAGASDAFGRTGLPGMPAEYGAGRFADPRMRR